MFATRCPMHGITPLRKDVSDELRAPSGTVPISPFDSKGLARMKKSLAVFTVVALVSVTGSNQGTSGGPGLTNPDSNKAVGQAEETVRLDPPNVSTAADTPERVVYHQPVQFRAGLAVRASPAILRQTLRFKIETEEGNTPEGISKDGSMISRNEQKDQWIALEPGSYVLKVQANRVHRQYLTLRNGDYMIVAIKEDAGTEGLHFERALVAEDNRMRPNAESGGWQLTVLQNQIKLDHSLEMLVTLENRADRAPERGGTLTHELLAALRRLRPAISPQAAVTISAPATIVAASLQQYSAACGVSVTQTDPAWVDQVWRTLWHLGSNPAFGAYHGSTEPTAAATASLLRECRGIFAESRLTGSAAQLADMNQLSIIFNTTPTVGTPLPPSDVPLAPGALDARFRL